MSERSGWIHSLRKLAGGEPARWAVLGMCASLGLSGLEYALALILQILLLKLGFASPSALPPWMHDFTEFALLTICGILVLSGLARSFLTFLAHHSACVFSHTLSSRLRLLTIYELLLSKDNRFLSSSVISTRMGEIFPQASGFVSNAITLIINGFQIVALIVGLFVFAWREAVIGLIGLGLIGGPVVFINRHVRRAASKLPKEQEGIFRKVERVTKNWLFVRISQTQTLEHARLSQSILRYASLALKSKWYGNLGASLPPLFGMIVLCSIILLSQSYFHTSVSSLVAFLYLYIRFTHQVSVNAKILTTMGAQYKHFTLAKDLLDQHSSEDLQMAMLPLRSKSMAFVSESEFINRTGLGRASTEVLEMAPSVKFEGVSFSWSPESRSVINGFSYMFESGKFIGIVGPSGAGKSTLLQLVLGLIQPQKGQVDLGGISGGEFMTRYSQYIGYVGPEPFLIDGTLRENLLYGNRNHCDDNEMWNVLQSAHLASEAKSLSKALDHRISELGEGLSMGQKQRLMLARALLRKPRLLVLDEVSANLDLNTELNISETLTQLKGKMTILAVSHRSALLRTADYLVEIEKGAVTVTVAGTDMKGD